MKKRKEQYITVKCKKLVFGGQGLAEYNGKKVFLWNALPDETVKALIVKKKKNYIEAVAVEIFEKSPFRIEEKETHFLSCSPWQIMAYTEEVKWKKAIATEMFKHYDLMDNDDEFELMKVDDINKYRNKMEYSFFYDDNDDVSLAFYRRAEHRRIAIKECFLANPVINKTAAIIVDWLNAGRFPVRSLKSLVLRSNSKGECIVGLFIKDKVSFLSLPTGNTFFKGLRIFYSDPRSPASRPDELLDGFGDEYIEENINDIVLRYGIFSFFQINIKEFGKALLDIRAYINNVDVLVDLYSGVGSISIALKGAYKHCIAVEINEEAKRYAEYNIMNNNIANYIHIAATAESVTEYIDKADVLLVDPPRAGLHKNIIRKIMEVDLDCIVYLSCNLSTQSRDLQELCKKYKIVFKKLYNFFPLTPHFESLVILKKKRSSTVLLS